MTINLPLQILIILIFITNIKYNEAQTCSPKQFRCTNDLCIRAVHACDADDDCGDGSDEINCTICRPGRFLCANGKCIKNINKCNSQDDCGDGSDELICGGCGPGDFQCNNGNCIKDYKKCDKQNDCSDGSDERDCDSCSSNEFRCTNKQCINQRLWCDGIQDCNDNSDETNCETAYKKPTFELTNLGNTTKFLNLGDKLKLFCNAVGIPKPSITWKLPGEHLTNWSSSLAPYLNSNNQILHVQNVSNETEGRYICTARNTVDTISEYVDVKVSANKHPVLSVASGKSVQKHVTSSVGINNLLMKLGIFFSGILVLVLSTFLVRYKYKQRKLNLLVAGISQKRFYEGDVENINPELTVSDQAHLLPYQQTSWEIPKQNLKLGSPLGSGAFGMVVKAQAYGVVEGEPSTTVAVKMIRPNADETHFKALMTELKIMAHLGKHLNIVNLIGARTTNLAKNKELLVVMEYCKHGSLLTYMHRNRNSFLNQFNPATDKIDPKISHQQAHSRQNQTSLGGNEMKSSSGYVSHSHFNKKGQPETGDQSISSTDLLSWAFQVAKGMEYLSSRKVLHGDLAARNVLLAENYIVKICDFGFSRETFRSYDYKKNTKGVLLPIKWMAIESIYCGLFSSKSDCWSFGVFLWELFTLGNKPYPGMDVDEEFCQKIQDGYRMGKPPNAPNSLYQIMLDCWSHDAPDRPLFSQVADRLGQLISESLRNHILELNERLIQQSSSRVSGQTDYLMRMGCCGETAAQRAQSHADSVPNQYNEIPRPLSEIEPSTVINIQNGTTNYCRFFQPRSSVTQARSSMS